MKKLLGLFLAPVAILAGLVCRRPVSGLWLAHYFLGRGGQRSLPKRFHGEIKRLAGVAPPAWARGKWESLQARHCTDLYTTVGGFSIRWLEDGSLEYRDPYDWHPDKEWNFAMSLPGLPFNLEIQGRDDWMTGVGREFLTVGVIPPDVGADSLTESSSSRPGLGWWWRNTLKLGERIATAKWDLIDRLPKAVRCEFQKPLSMVDMDSEEWDDWFSKNMVDSEIPF